MIRPLLNISDRMILIHYNNSFYAGKLEIKLSFAHLKRSLQQIKDKFK